MNAVSATRRQYRELPDGTIELKLHIDPPFKKQFLELFGEIDMPVAIAPLDPKAVNAGFYPEKPDKTTTIDNAQKSDEIYRSLAQKMHRDGYFRNPKLWAAMERAGIYTQAKHKAWVEQRPCCTSNLSKCFGDIVAHHVTSADLPASGNPNTPRKVPDWYCVPLCAINHHQDWAHNKATREEKKQLQIFAIDLTAQQMKTKMREHLGIESLSEITQEMLDQFEREIAL